MVKGCTAGAKLFLSPGFEIKSITPKAFKASEDLGNGYRSIILSAVESDGWETLNTQYECVFAENFTFAQQNHNAALYQLRVNEQVYGMQGDKLLGDLQDHMRLIKAVEKAMK